jgi:hypothetical protein
MVDILAVWVGSLLVSVSYDVGVLHLAVVVASGRQGVRLGLDFGNSKDSVGHRAVGKGLGRRLSLMPFFTSGEQGAEPPAERAAPQGPRLQLGRRNAKQTLRPS